MPLLLLLAFDVGVWSFRVKTWLILRPAETFPGWLRGIGRVILSQSFARRLLACVVKVGNGDVFEGQFEGNLKNGIGVYHYHDGECDLSRYEDDVRVGESVRWSADRKKAFVLTEEPSVREVSLEEASSIAMKKMGTVVAY